MIKKLSISLTFIFILSFVSGAFAQNTSNINHNNKTSKYSKESIKKARDAGEIILFESELIDLGLVKKGEFKDLTFNFLNISDEVIEYNFFDVCSCSKLTYDEDAKIKPGEEGTFHIVFDSGAREEVEPVEVSFELKNIDQRNKLPYFYTVKYLFEFK